MYRIKKKGKTQGEHLIEKKYEHTIEFTMAQIESHEYQLEKTLKEFQAKLELENAKMENIKHHHSWVATLSPEELHTAHMFFESVAFINMIGPKMKEIKKQMKEYKTEKAEIKKALNFKDEGA
jgi:predicted  nucleic acid-binding Zn-ribbon protein